MSTDWQQKIEQLQGPILVLGAGGFIGASLLGTVRALGVARVPLPAGNLAVWRFQGGRP